MSCVASSAVVPQTTRMLGHVGFRVILCVLLVLNQGGALKCFESMCLGDPTTCGYDDSLVLRKCNTGVLRDLLAESGLLPFPSLLLKLVPMTCLKQQAGDISLKMCFPRIPKLCSGVGFLTRKLLPSIDEEAFIQCHSCNTDACNAAGASGPAGAAICGAALVSLLRVAALA